MSLNTVTRSAAAAMLAWLLSAAPDAAGETRKLEREAAEIQAERKDVWTEITVKADLLVRRVNVEKVKMVAAACAP